MASARTSLSLAGRHGRQARRAAHTRLSSTRADPTPAKTNAKAGSQILSFSRGLTAVPRLVSAMTFSFPVDIRQSVNYPLLCRMSRGHVKQTQTDSFQ